MEICFRMYYFFKTTAIGPFQHNVGGRRTLCSAQKTDTTLQLDHGQRGLIRRWRNILHLMWDCTFAQQSRFSFAPHKNRGISFFDEVLLLHQTLPKKIAMDIIIMGCWNIWMHRNGIIFRNEIPSLRSWKYKFK